MSDSQLINNKNLIETSFDNLPDHCFINPSIRPHGIIIATKNIVTMNYKGLKIENVYATKNLEQPNIIRLLISKKCGITLRLGYGNEIEISQGVQGKYKFTLWHNSSLYIGEGTTANLLEGASMNGTINIGKNCMISNAWIQGSDMHGVWSIEEKKLLNKTGFSVCIGDNVWVGRNSSIVRPVIVGNGSIIAFGAIVTKDVPAFSIVAGNPAIIIKKNVTWTRKFNIDEFNNALNQLGLSTDEGTEQLKEDIQIKPDHIQPVLQLAEIYESQENWTEATKCDQRIVGLEPDNSNSYLKMAKTLQEQGKIYGAIAAYQEAIELNPNLPAKVYKELGDLLIKQPNNVEEAIAIYRKALANNPDWQPGVGYFLKLADALNQDKRLEESIVYYRKVIELKPEYTKAYSSLGNVFFKMGRVDEATGCYQKAIQLQPNTPIAQKKLGDIFKQKGQLDLASQYYQKALELKPEMNHVYPLLGDVFSQ